MTQRTLVFDDETSSFSGSCDMSNAFKGSVAVVLPVLTAISVIHQRFRNFQTSRPQALLRLLEFQKLRRDHQ